MRKKILYELDGVLQNHLPCCQLNDGTTPQITDNQLDICAFGSGGDARLSFDEDLSIDRVYGSSPVVWLDDWTFFGNYETERIFKTQSDYPNNEIRKLFYLGRQYDDLSAIFDKRFSQDAEYAQARTLDNEDVLLYRGKTISSFKMNNGDYGPIDSRAGFFFREVQTDIYAAWTKSRIEFYRSGQPLFNVDATNARFVGLSSTGENSQTEPSQFNERTSHCYFTSEEGVYSCDFVSMSATRIGDTLHAINSGTGDQPVWNRYYGAVYATVSDGGALKTFYGSRIVISDATNLLSEKCDKTMMLVMHNGQVTIFSNSVEVFSGNFSSGQDPLRITYTHDVSNTFAAFLVGTSDSGGTSWLPGVHIVDSNGQHVIERGDTTFDSVETHGNYVFARIPDQNPYFDSWFAFYSARYSFDVDMLSPRFLECDDDSIIVAGRGWESPRQFESIVYARYGREMISIRNDFASGGVYEGTIGYGGGCIFHEQPQGSGIFSVFTKDFEEILSGVNSSSESNIRFLRYNATDGSFDEHVNFSTLRCDDGFLRVFSGGAFVGSVDNVYDIRDSEGNNLSYKNVS